MDNFKIIETMRYFILAAEREGNRRFHDALKEYDITVSQAEVLRVLLYNEPLSLKELGDLLICENGSPSRLVERLVKEELVSKVKSDSDARAVLLTLTQMGREKAEAVLSIEHRVYKVLSQILPSETINEINNLLAPLLNLLPIGSALRKRGFIPNDSQSE